MEFRKGRATNFFVSGSSPTPPRPAPVRPRARQIRRSDDSSDGRRQWRYGGGETTQAVVATVAAPLRRWRQRERYRSARGHGSAAHTVTAALPPYGAARTVEPSPLGRPAGAVRRQTAAVEDARETPGRRQAVPSVRPAQIPRLWVKCLRTSSAVSSPSSASTASTMAMCSSPDWVSSPWSASFCRPCIRA